MNIVRLLWAFLTCQIHLSLKIRRVRQLNRLSFERGIKETSSPKFQVQLDLLVELSQETEHLRVELRKLKGELSLSLKRKKITKTRNKRE